MGKRRSSTSSKKNKSVDVVDLMDTEDVQEETLENTEEEIDHDNFLLPIGDRIIGTSTGLEKENTVIVTCENTGVQVYEIIDQKCIKNWTTNKKLQCATVQDPKSRRFFTSIEPFTVSSWAHNSLDISSKIDKHLGDNNKIFKLHSGRTARKKWSSVAVTVKEKIFLLDHKMNVVSSLTNTTDSKSNVVWSSLVTIEDDDYIFTIKAKKGIFIFTVFSIYNEPCIKERISVDLGGRLKKLRKRVISACFESSGGVGSNSAFSSYLSILWENGTGSIWHFDSVSQLVGTTATTPVPVSKLDGISKPKPLKVLGCETEFSYPSDLVPSSTSASIELFAMDENLFGLVGKSKSSGEMKLCTFHAIWGSILSTQTLKQPQETTAFIKNAPNYFISSRVVYFPDSRYVTVAYEKEICVCKVKVSSGTLAESVGSLINEVAKEKQKTDHYFVPSLCVDALFSTDANKLDFKGSVNNIATMRGLHKNKIAQESKSELRVLELLTDRSLTPTFDDFMEIYTPYIRSRTQKRYTITTPFLEQEEEKNSLTASFATFSELDHEVANVSSLFVSKVATRCLEEKFWLPLRQLLISGLLSFSLIHEQLLTLLMKEKQVELLHICLVKLKDLDERYAVKLIEFFMQNKKEKFLLDYLAKYLRIDSDSSLDGTQFLNLIFNLPTNEAFTVHSLYSLKTSLVVELLAYLLKYLKVYSSSSIEELKLNSLCVPSYENVVNWATMIVDAQSTNLLLANKEAILLLADIRAELRVQISICKNIQNMRGWISHILARNEMPDSSGQTYSIEVFYA